MSQYGYGGQSNPYDQRGGSGYGGGYGSQQPYDNVPPYGNPYPQEPSMGQVDYNYNGQSHEMASLTQNSDSFAQDPNAILNELRDIDMSIDAAGRDLEQLKAMQQRSLDADSKDLNDQVERLSQDIKSKYRSLNTRLRAIKSQPESQNPRNAPQVGKVDRKLKAAVHQFSSIENEFGKKMRTQLARQYRIVRPDASEAEVQAAVEDGNTQVFSQALMQGTRRAEAQSTLRNVQNRHEAIKKVEQQLIELAQLFEEMNQLVEMQAPAIAQIEAKGEEVVVHMDKANEQISSAIVSARARNRKKWWCLLIAVIIIIIVVIIVVVYVEVNKSGSSSKRKRALDSLKSRPAFIEGAMFHESLGSTSRAVSQPVIPGASFHESVDLVPRGLKWSGRRFLVPDLSAKNVIPGEDWKPVN